MGPHGATSAATLQMKDVAGNFCACFDVEYFGCRGRETMTEDITRFKCQFLRAKDPESTSESTCL